MKRQVIVATILGELVLCAQSGNDRPAAGQSNAEKSDELATDRPGYTTPPNVVGQGTLQFESGLSFQASGAGANREHALLLGSPLLRFGIGHRVELRLAEDGFHRSQYSTEGSRAQTLDGWSDMTLGVKIEIVDPSRNWPAISLLPAISVPTGARTFTSAAYDPSLGMAWSERLGKFSLSGTVILASASTGSERFFKRSSATSFWSPSMRGWVGFGEIYLNVPGDGSPTWWVFDGGVTRTIGHRSQIDFEIGRGLTAAAPAWSVSGGYVFRYDFARGWRSTSVKPEKGEYAAKFDRR